MQTTYVGSDDDVALNEGVDRFEADEDAVAALAYDSDLSGNIVLPVLTLHARYDPTVSVDHEAAYRRTVEAAGRSHLLVQTFTDEAVHHPLASPEYVTLFDAISRWIETDLKPSPTSISALCEQIGSRRDEPCHFDPDFHPWPASR